MAERTVSRVILGLLAVPAVIVGVWAAFAPRSFYDSFPGLGRQWVSPDGPFNEHLVRDVGALNLALAIVTVAAAVALGPVLVRSVALAWLVEGVIHLAYHAENLDPFSNGDRVLEMVSLALVPVGALVVLGLSLRRVRAGSSPRVATARVP